MTILQKFLFTDIHYIGGASSLPPPLTKEEEDELIEKFRLDPKSVRTELIERNLRLVVYISKKFENTKINIEDLIKEEEMVILISNLGYIKRLPVTAYKTQLFYFVK